VFEVVATTPKIKPKMETVPSSMPNTTVPTDLTSETCSRCIVEAKNVIVVPQPR
jgi:hypothetical protein